MMTAVHRPKSIVAQSCTDRALERTRPSLQSVVYAIFGGVGAISPRLYGRALERIADITGRTVDQAFRSEVSAIIGTMPCPLD